VDFHSFVVLEEGHRGHRRPRQREQRFHVAARERADLASCFGSVPLPDLRA
jgi:hypothetical protein